MLLKSQILKKGRGAAAAFSVHRTGLQRLRKFMRAVVENWMTVRGRFCKDVGAVVHAMGCEGLLRERPSDGASHADKKRNGTPC